MTEEMESRHGHRWGPGGGEAEIGDKMEKKINWWSSWTPLDESWLLGYISLIPDLSKIRRMGFINPISRFCDKSGIKEIYPINPLSSDGVQEDHQLISRSILSPISASSPPGLHRWPWRLSTSPIMNLILMSFCCILSLISSSWCSLSLDSSLWPWLPLNL